MKLDGKINTINRTVICSGTSGANTICTKGSLSTAFPAWGGIMSNPVGWAFGVGFGAYSLGMYMWDRNNNAHNKD